MKTTTILLLLLLFFSACKKDFFVKGEGDLSFSTDTLTFDTVFTSLGSATRYFKIINDKNTGIEIENVYLAGGKSSPFRINLNADPGTAFQNVIIPPNDSLYIFVEVTVDPTDQNNPFIILDSVIFETGKAQQKVILAAWGQNAYFHNGDIICNETWINDKPHVVFNSMLVDSNCALTIEPGVQVHFHAGSSMFVNGTLKVNGTLDAPVVFQGDRLERFFEDLPGQWGATSGGVSLGGIHLTTSSTNNEVNYAEIKNGTVGIRVDSLPANAAPKLTIRNSIIKNMSKSGIEAYTSYIYAENTLIYNIGKNNVALYAGGVYDFIHCTFANYSGTTINHRDPILRLGNYFIIGETQYIVSMDAAFTNCIIYGSEENEFATDFEPGVDTTYLFDHCLIRTTRPTGNAALYNNVLKNADPLFENISEEDYHLQPSSPCIDAGRSTGVTVDLEQKARDNNPDLGVYEKN